MKRIIPLLLALILLLSGCGRREEAPQEPAEEPPAADAPEAVQAITAETPLRLESLRVEVSRGGLSSERLMEAARRLPGLLKEALEACHIYADTVQVTIGSSSAATVQALNGGAVDIAVLPAEGFAGQETEAAVLLASGPGAEEEPLWTDSAVGFRGAVCAAATDYGRNLASRAGKEGDLPTWDEMNRARWGLLGADSLLGRRAVDLWLADNYEGSASAGLSRVTVYGDFEELLRAAEAGEVDVFPADSRTLAVWEGGEAALPALFSLGETGWFYDMVLAVSPRREDLSAPELNLKDPLMSVLTQLCWYDGAQTLPDGTPAFPGKGYDRETRLLCQDVFGPYRYAWAEDGDLDDVRRLLALEGHTAE